MNKNESPKFSRIELVHIAAPKPVKDSPLDRRRPLERILADVDDRRHIGCDLLPWPTVRLLIELEFEIINPNGAKMGTTLRSKLTLMTWGVF